MRPIQFRISSNYKHGMISLTLLYSIQSKFRINDAFTEHILNFKKFEVPTTFENTA